MKRESQSKLSSNNTPDTKTFRYRVQDKMRAFLFRFPNGYDDFKESNESNGAQVGNHEHDDSLKQGGVKPKRLQEVNVQ